MPLSHLNGGFAGGVGDHEVEGDILAVHVLVHPAPDPALLLAGRGGVEVVPVGVVEGGPGEHQRELVSPLRLVTVAGGGFGAFRWK